MLGKKLKEIRENKRLVQREAASVLQVDTAYISKIESNEKPLSRDALVKLAEYYQYPIDELLVLWLSDKIYKIIKDDELAIDSLNQTIIRIKEERSK